MRTRSVLIAQMVGLLLTAQLGWTGPLPTLTIVSPHWEGIRSEFETAFRKEISASGGPEIRFSWLDAGGTAEILRFLKSEFSHSPNGIGVDIVFGGGLEPYLELKRLGLLDRSLDPYGQDTGIPAALGGVPLRDPEGYWVGANLAGFGILCNRKALSAFGLPQPRAWEDLAQPEYFGLISMADPAKSGSIHMACEVILQHYGWQRGWEILFLIARNVRAFVSSSSQQLSELISGEALCSFAHDAQAWSLIRDYGGDAFSFELPEQATVVNPDAIARLKGASQPMLAQRFINFVLSREGQRLWFFKSGVPGGPLHYELARLPILPEVYQSSQNVSSVRYNPFEARLMQEYDYHRGAQRWDLVNDLSRVLLLGRHAALQRAWRVGDASNAEYTTRFLALPKWDGSPSQYSDPLLRQRLIRSWELALEHRLRSSVSLWDRLRAVPLILLLLLGMGGFLKRTVLRGRHYGQVIFSLWNRR